MRVIGGAMALMSMGWCKKDVTPLLTHWSYVFLALTHRCNHDDVIKWKHFPRYWPFSVRGIPRSPVNSPHKGQWRGALMFSLICACINGWVNNRKAGDVRRHRIHYDVIVIMCIIPARTARMTFSTGIVVPWRAPTQEPSSVTPGSMTRVSWLRRPLLRWADAWL